MGVGWPRFSEGTKLPYISPGEYYFEFYLLNMASSSVSGYGNIKKLK